ncbi:MAG TPA: SBBP repeat-containing protein [Gemmatimonadales bacterium]|jgi:hypothetical protein
MALPRNHPVRLFAAALTCLLVSGCGDSPTDTTPIVPGDPQSFSLTPSFATYLGGSGEESIRGAAVDAQGNVYVTGATQSANFLATSGAFATSFHASGIMLMDAFVTKYDPAGHVIWSTFLGGPEYDRAYAIEVDEQGYVYVAGRAGPGFPVTPGAAQTTFAGGTLPDGAYGPQDGFVCKLKPDGSGVVFCTYLGNATPEVIRDIAIDANHNIYVATATTGADPFPAAWFANAFQKTVHGAEDALIVKIRSDGSAVEWATYLGGSGNESNGNSVRVDGTGVFLAINTQSSDMPTPNGFDHSLGGGGDIYVAKLSLDGSQLLYGTYVGGSGNEGAETHQLALDGQSNAIIAVGSSSSDFPVSAGAFQATAGGGPGDVLVVKVSPGGALVAATYLGGDGNEFAEGVAADQEGNLWLSGTTTSAAFPVTGGQGAAGGSDLIVVGLSPDLKKLVFSRRLGGSGNDPGRAIAVNASTLVAAGQSDSPNWPVRQAAQSAPGGNLDGMIAVFRKGD